jgi:hypothetical protein
MSMRHVIILLLFVVAQGFMSASRVAFSRALAAANEKLPGADAIDRRQALLQWRSVRRKLRSFADASRALTRSDAFAAVGLLTLLALAAYVVATWDQA